MGKTKSRTRKQLKYMGGMEARSHLVKINNNSWIKPSIMKKSLLSLMPDICQLCGLKFENKDICKPCFKCKKQFHKNCLIPYCEAVDSGPTENQCPNCDEEGICAEYKPPLSDR